MVIPKINFIFVELMLLIDAHNSTTCVLHTWMYFIINRMPKQLLCHPVTIYQLLNSKKHYNESQLKALILCRNGINKRVEILRVWLITDSDIFCILRVWNNNILNMQARCSKCIFSKSSRKRYVFTVKLLRVRSEKKRMLNIFTIYIWQIISSLSVRYRSCPSFTVDLPYWSLQ